MEKEKEAYFEGTEIVIRGKKYIVPGLSLAQLEDHAKDIDKLMESIDKIDNADSKVKLSDVIGMMGDLVHMAFSRNYPDISRKEFMEMVDVRIVTNLTHSIMGESGFEISTGSHTGEPMPAARKLRK